MVAGRDRPRLRPDADQPQPARAVPRLPDHRQQHRRAQRRGVRGAGDRRRSLPLERRLPHPDAPAPDAGLRRACRHLARPVLRAEVRAGHRDSVAAAVHRERRPGGRLLLRLFLRLHRLDQLGVADRPAADGARPALGLRHAVRRRRHAAGSCRAARRGPQHPRLDRPGHVTPAQHARRRRSGAAERLPRGHPRDRAPHPARRGAEPQRRGARAARRADRRARLVRGAHQADVRPAGAGVRLGHHSRVRVQARTRRVEPGVRRQRHQHRLPLRVASRRSRGPRHRVRPHQPLSHRHDAVLPGQAEADARRRRHAARQHAGALRIADGQLERAQPQALPAVPRRPRRRRDSRAACTSRPPTARRWPIRCCRSRTRSGSTSSPSATAPRHSTSTRCPARRSDRRASRRAARQLGRSPHGLPFAPPDPGRIPTWLARGARFS